MSQFRNTFTHRRAVTLFVAAGTVAFLSLTSQWWLPALPTLFGVIEANNELIGAFASLVNMAYIVGLLVVSILSYLGFRSLRNSNAGQVPQQAVDVAEKGRGVAVGGDVNQGTVVVGDQNKISVEISEGVTYNYSDFAPTLPTSDKLEEARRRFEDLPLGNVPPRAGLPSGSVMPLRPNRYFVGREEQLKRIAASLKTGAATAIGEVTVAASSGLGGVGKTQLASEFVYRYGQFFHGVYWLSFAEPGDVPAKIASCGGAGGMDLRPDFHTLPLEDRVKAVMSEWQNDLPRLLVFDNCEDDDLLDQWLPPAGASRVLVTSRRGSWSSTLGVIELPLDVLEREESVELLRKYRSDLRPNSPDLNAIAEELGDLPLALDLAGRYLAQCRIEVTLAAYLTEIQRPELLDHRSLRKARGPSPTKHDMDVWRTFALSYWRLDHEDRTDGLAVRLLARAARLAPNVPAPGYLLAWTLESPEEDGDPPQPTTDFRDALDRLENLGLLEALGNETFRMHPLVAAFVLTEVPDEESHGSVEAACYRAAMHAQREGQPARLEALLPHVRFVTVPAQERTDSIAANCCTALSVCLRQIRAYDEALPYAERAWEISVELYGRNDQATLRLHSNSASILNHKGDKETAKTVYEEVLEAQERYLGPDDPDVAATCNNLGAMYMNDDLFHNVLSLYERALRIRESSWANTPPKNTSPENNLKRREAAYRVAESYGNMGFLLLDLGRHRQARPHLENSFRILSEEVKEMHERNADTLVKLGRALWAQEEYTLAALNLGKALAIHRHISTTPPPEMINLLAIFGGVLKEWAEKDNSLPSGQREQTIRQARDCLREGLNSAEHVYGKGHPVTGGILTALSEVCDVQGATEDSRRYRERAETTRRDNLQGDDLDTAANLNAQGTKLIAHGLYEEACIYLRRALNIRKDKLGEQDFDTSTSLLKLGILYQLQGCDAQARSCLERALSTRTNICGEHHAATELVRKNLNLLRD